MNASVEITELDVSFFGRPALRRVSVSFPARGISLILGRSGSGKSTLLRGINRLNEEFEGCASTGRVRVDLGRGLCDIYPESCRGAAGDKPEPAAAGRAQGSGEERGVQALSLAELRRRIGMLFQTPNLFPMSVYRNLALPLTLTGLCTQKEAPDRIRTALEYVGLWKELRGRLDLPAQGLSGGQQQRLCLARLLALEPALLLLDEPTASLDVHASRHIEELLRDIARERAVIMVSHSLSQALRMGGSVWICEQGSIKPACPEKGGAQGFAAEKNLSEELLAKLLE
ncbi:ATP-binding cassette domain-containing protein [Desulfovibrio sp. OttesenSCG-928-A18]|nr:ATP-binding cassette domain-containing protein [Desulfovibrio sp. OttesenSCG-928-A18]